MEDISKSTAKSQLPRIFISRPLDQAQDFIEVFQQIPAQITGFPLIETQLLPITLNPNDLNSYQWLFFTSQIAAEHLLKEIHPFPKHIRIGVVGSATAAAVEAKTKKQPDYISPRANAKAMAQDFISSGQKGAILWPCGNLANPEFKELLKTQPIQPLVIYETSPCLEVPSEIKDRLKKGMDFIVFTSPSSVLAFQKHQLSLNQARLISMGPSTSEAIRKTLKTEPLEAAKQTLEGLGQTLANQLQGLPKPSEKTSP